MAPSSGDVLLELPARPESVSAARSAVDSLGVEDEDCRQVLLVVVSELVTNAIRHAGLRPEDRLTLCATRSGDRVRVEVVDQGEGFDRARVTAIEPSARGGFGLRIVTELSERWGVIPGEGTVWAEVRTQAPVACRLDFALVGVMTDSTHDAFYIESELTAGAAVIRPVGELDIATADELGAAVERSLRSDAATVVLDLGAVTFIDSAGVRCLLMAVATSESVGDKLRIRREQSEQVTRVLDLVGALDRLPYE